MNKKKSLIAVVAFVLFSLNVMAQDNAYPRYGFWSNWKLGAEAIYNQQFGTPGGFLGWRHSTDAGFGIVLEKELTHVWDLRLHGAIPGIFTNVPDGTPGWYDRYGKLTADVKFNINDAIAGYNPERRFSVYALAGAGISDRYAVERYGKFAALLQGGLGVSCDFGKHGTFYAEYVVDNVADIADPNFVHDLHGSAVVGLMFRFGPTQKDLDRIANANKPSQEDYDALNNQVNRLSGKLDDAQQQEARLNQRVNELEQQLAEAEAAAKENDNDELDAAINGISDDNVAFRALPFSVLFENDSYGISPSQMEKIEAVAQVMKENPDLRISVVGYCDYTASEEYNQQLSERRAQVVKDQLVKLGVDESRLTNYGKGKTTAFGDIKSGVNRRVSFYRIID